MERPIILKAHEVRGILDGRQTQLRRIITPQPEHKQLHRHKGKVIYDSGHRMWCWKDIVVDNIWDFPNGDDRKALARGCSFGQVGDRLWGRETWNDDWCDEVLYKATIAGTAKEAGYSREPVWRSSTQMPRHLSRILLEIVSVRVERVQDTKRADARACGAVDDEWDEWCEDVTDYAPPGSSIENERDAFEKLWRIYYGNESWDANCWIWVVEFKRINAE